MNEDWNLFQEKTRIYSCKRCTAIFLFREDVDQHRVETGHSEILEVNLEPGA